MVEVKKAKGLSFYNSEPLQQLPKAMTTTMTTAMMMKLAPLSSAPAPAPHGRSSKGFSGTTRSLPTRAVSIRLALIAFLACLSVSYGQAQTMGCMDGPDRPGSCEETFTDAVDCVMDQGSCEPEVAKCRASCGTAGCACRFNQYQCVQAPCEGSYFCGGEVTSCSTYDTEGACGLEAGCVWGLMSDESSPPSDVPSMVPAPSAPTAIVPDGVPSALPTIVPSPTSPTDNGGGSGNGGAPGSTSGAVTTSVRSSLVALAFGALASAAAVAGQF
jgi:hypothetical protein